MSIIFFSMGAHLGPHGIYSVHSDLPIAYVAKHRG
jgi:hypothetical protein